MTQLSQKVLIPHECTYERGTPGKCGSEGMDGRLAGGCEVWAAWKAVEGWGQLGEAVGAAGGGAQPQRACGAGPCVQGPKRWRGQPRSAPWGGGVCKHVGGCETDACVPV